MSRCEDPYCLGEAGHSGHHLVRRTGHAAAYVPPVDNTAENLARAVEDMGPHGRWEFVREYLRAYRARNPRTP